jgi:hypothetical protein
VTTRNVSMSTLTFQDKHRLENFLRTANGYVLSFSDRTFQEFVFEHTGKDIHSERYCTAGTSKANKLRSFWKLESDHLVGSLIDKLITFECNHDESLDRGCKMPSDCHAATIRRPGSKDLQVHAEITDAVHLSGAIEPPVERSRPGKKLHRLRMPRSITAEHYLI